MSPLLSYPAQGLVSAVARRRYPVYTQKINKYIPLNTKKDEKTFGKHFSRYIWSWVFKHPTSNVFEKTFGVGRLNTQLQIFVKKIFGVGCLKQLVFFTNKFNILFHSPFTCMHYVSANPCALVSSLQVLLLFAVVLIVVYCRSLVLSLSLFSCSPSLLWPFRLDLLLVTLTLHRVAPHHQVQVSEPFFCKRF